MKVIRSIKRQDLPYLKSVLDSSELFPSEMLDDMISDYFDNGESRDIWFTSVVDEIPVSIAYCAPEKMTEGTYNLYAIAVEKKNQGKGIGREMMAYLEDLLRTKRGRILIVETSGLPQFELTRKFYDQCNYKRQALIPEFYDVGEDKVVFWKKLTS